MDLASVKCIISGGAQGLGRHFALRLAQAGAQVAIGDVNPQGDAETLELGCAPSWSGRTGRWAG
jgi:3-oxoacyl-[acyl-carrier protein] reductase